MSDDDPCGPAVPKPAYERFAMGLFKVIDRPVTWFREKVVLPNQKNYPYYHRRYRRVPTIDECYTDDAVCIYEANQQHRRDKLVDSQIVKILRQKKIECYTWEGPDAKYKCNEVTREYEEAATNWFIKYGDIPITGDVRDVYMKQKHRLIYERRHGQKLY